MKNTIAADDQTNEAPKTAPVKAWADAAPKAKRKRVKQVRTGTIHKMRVSDERTDETSHEIEDAPWGNPASLAAPAPRPGMVQRWIRIGSLGKPDPINLSRKMREGWRPRPADSVPARFSSPTIQAGQFTGGIGVEGMVLMEMPIARDGERNAYYKERQGRMTESINSQLAEATRGRRGTGFGPIEKAQKSEVGHLRRAVVAEEE